MTNFRPIEERLQQAHGAFLLVLGQHAQIGNHIF
jgi:hypothetical protein